MRRLAWLVCLGVVAGSAIVPQAQIRDDQSPPPIGADQWPTFRAGTVARADAPARAHATRWTGFEVR